MLQGINEKDGFPPAGDLMQARNFQPINKSMEDGAFVQSINQVMRAPFEGKTWFEKVEIFSEDDKLSNKNLDNLLKKHGNPESPQDAMAIMRNRFIFGLDHYKLWFITDVEIYKPTAKTKAKAKFNPKPVHQEQFVSLYDLRDHFEIQNLEIENRDAVYGGKFTNNLWTQDNGKLYFDTVKQLAAQNARMMKQFLLDQPPFNLTIKPESTAVLALYDKPPRTGKRRSKMSPERERRVERKNDAEAMKEMDALHRKAYMLPKKYDYVRPVSIMEKTPGTIVARDLDKNVYYSVPTKNLKLVLQSEIDPAEYDRLIQFPEEEPPAAQTDGLAKGDGMPADVKAEDQGKQEAGTEAAEQ